MKGNLFTNNTYFLLLTAIFLLGFSACYSPQSSEDVSSIPEQISPTFDDPSSASDAALVAYDNFLNGSRKAQDLAKEISDGVLSIDDISLEPELKTYYAFFDMNKDGIQELHLRPTTGGGYVIFTYQNEQIVLWHQGPDYESPLNNGAILYERDGAAPTHINYYYMVLDSDGNTLSKVEFSKYHSVDQDSLKENPNYDEFIFNDKYVSEEEWNSLTDEYLSVSSDLIIWNEK